MIEKIIKNIKSVVMECNDMIFYKYEPNGDLYWLFYDDIEGIKILYGKQLSFIMKIGQKGPTTKTKKFPTNPDEIKKIYKHLKKLLLSGNDHDDEKLLTILTEGLPDDIDQSLNAGVFEFELQDNKVKISFDSEADMKKLNEFLFALEKQVIENDKISKQQYFELKTEIELLKKQIQDRDGLSASKTLKRLWSTISNVGTVIGYVQLFLWLM